MISEGFKQKKLWASRVVKGEGWYNILLDITDSIGNNSSRKAR